MNKLKFLIDVGVGKIVEKWLQNEGYDVKCARDIDARLSDREILKIAAKEPHDHNYGQRFWRACSQFRIIARRSVVVKVRRYGFGAKKENC